MPRPNHFGDFAQPYAAIAQGLMFHFGAHNSISTPNLYDACMNLKPKVKSEAGYNLPHAVRTILYTI